MYCGNNRLEFGLLDGSLKMGNRYDCLKKGIGKGLTLPSYNGGNYDPIDSVRIYCGKNPTLPEGYDRMGNLVECLRKGIGVGKSRSNVKNNNKVNYRSSYYDDTIIFGLLIFIVILMIICIFLRDKINRQKIQIDQLLRERRRLEKEYHH